MRGNVKVYQKKIVDRRRKRLFFFFLLSLLFVGLIFSGLSYFSQLDALTIKEVSVEGAVRLDPSSIAAMADSRMEGNYLYFFSKRNIFLYPRNGMENEIAALPLVKEVKVKGDGEGGILISIVERSEAALWCDGDRGMPGDCFSADETGLIFAPAGNAQGIIYRGRISAEDAIGSEIMPEGEFKNMQFFVRELIALNIEPVEVSIEDAGYMEVLLRKGGRLIINASDDLSAVLSNLSTVLSDKSSVPDLDVFLGRLDYIRLDSGNKVFYKLK